MEYHDPETDNHFTAPDPVSLPDAKDLFEDYRRGGTQWATKVAWKQMEIPSGTRKGCAGASVLLIALAMGGAGKIIQFLT